MYTTFFGLNREPFSIAPDPHFLFMSEMHREALAHLLYGVGGGGGFVLLTGEVGAGKTTVCRCLLEQMPAHCNVAYIVNPKLSAVELLQTVCDEFGVAAPAHAPGPTTVKDCVDPLNAFMLEAHAQGRNNVLIIDEAQSLSAEVLEQLRLLTNLETHERKLLQIVLIGQPELRAMLARPELEQLAQRVIARYHLPALSAAQTTQYLHHRLAVAGLQGEPPFDAGALRSVHRLSAGVPRRINLLCDRALLGAFAHERRRIDAGVVERAAREVFGAPAPRTPRPWERWALVGGGVAAGALAAAAWLGPRSPDVVPPVLALAPAASAPGAAAPAPIEPATAPTAIADEAQAWAELAALWDVRLGEGAPCEQALRQGLQCFQTRDGLGLVRQLGRPGIVTLQEGERHRGYALLVALDEQQATLQMAGRLQNVPLATLATMWRGDFATLWRQPPGYQAAAPRAAEPWVASQLAKLAQAGGTARSAQNRVAAFQLAQGLQPDGQVGPLTLMQLNRVAGVAEPRLDVPAAPAPTR